MTDEEDFVLQCKAELDQSLGAMAEQYMAEVQRVKTELEAALGPWARHVMRLARILAPLLALFEPKHPPIKHRHGPRSYRKRWPQ
jgi:hypothetical protein